MWRRLDDPQLLSLYERELSSGFDDDMLSLLERLSRADFCDRVWVATSLGKLRFTLAACYSEERNWPAVWVVAKGGRYAISFVDAGVSTASIGSSCDRVGLVEAVKAAIARHLVTSTR